MILHLCTPDKFIAPYYDFLATSFEGFDGRHLFYIHGSGPISRVPTGDNVYFGQQRYDRKTYAWLVRNLNRADQIILHGMWDYRVVMLLALQPWLLKKCYWAIWGGDLYRYQEANATGSWCQREVLRRFVIKRLGHFITHVKGDYELAKKWYGAKGVWHECFLYPSNLYVQPSVSVAEHTGLNILLGNSANPSNHHIEVLDRLKANPPKNFKIYCPLSYGDASNAQKVADHGAKLFGRNFIALRDFCALDEYRDLLAQIDIAIFNHRRQQAMGNIVSLLGSGKKVYLRKDVTTWQTLRDLGLDVYDLNDLSLTVIDEHIAKANIDRIARYFSGERLYRQWAAIFGV